MKQQLYPRMSSFSFASIFKGMLVLAFLTVPILFPRAQAQGLVFKNSSLVSGTNGQINAVYRFPQVTTNVDALVTITGRSSSQVTLTSIDLTNLGFDKAFQPQVTYNGGTTPNGTSDWWMEFSISFVTATTTNTVNVASFNVTALDIDGNADKINEWVGFYNLSTYTVENNSILQYGSIYEMVNSVNTAVGTKFVGPIANYTNIDTAATSVMATANYINQNNFRVRTGGHSIGSSGASDRMYSFWFKTFTFQAPVNLNLPVTLQSFTAKLENKKPVISWVSSVEQQLSHYVIERSTNGSEFSEAALVFANGTSSIASKYSFSDNAMASLNKGMLYYRLRMVDADGKFTYSETRLVKMNPTTASAGIAIQAYPNPAVNEIRVTLPSGWQEKQIQYDIYAVNGQVMKSMNRQSASQTEVLNISTLPVGSYIIKVSAGTETATERFVKSK